MDRCVIWAARELGKGNEDMTKKLTTTALIIAFAAASQASGQAAQAWKTRPMGGTTVGGTIADGPGAAAYGADKDITAVVYIDGLFPFEPPLAVEINPWYRIDGFDGDRAISYPGVGHVSDDADGVFPNAFTRGLDKVADRLETARQQWLKDNGYVGGVRVFGSTGGAPASEAGSALPEPRGIIVVPDRIKRQKTRFQVRADEPSTAVQTVRLDGGAVRMSLPPTMRVSTFHVVTPRVEQEQVASTDDRHASTDGGL
jgi:hypothetical protein